MTHRLHAFANPVRFRRLSDAVLPWVALLTVLLFGAGLWFSLIDSPPDYQQKETVRIMYVHVPAAWTALFAYVSMAVASFVALVWKHPLAEVAAKGIAPIGAAFTVIGLITGALWGKPMWGAYWVWDARLTSFLVLLFLYLGYMALSEAFDDPVVGGRMASILALVGVVNLPIIHFSVEWWNTLHQPNSVSGLGKPSISNEMLMPLFIMAFAFKAFFVSVLLVRIRSELAERKIRVLRLTAVQSQSGGTGS